MHSKPAENSHRESAGRPVSDEELQRAVETHLGSLAAAALVDTGGRHIGLVETAGGPGSPGPSGRLQVLNPTPLTLLLPFCSPDF